MKHSDQSFDTGTSASLLVNTWGVALMSIDAATDPSGSGATRTVTWATNSGSGYSTEAAAIAALPATPSNHAPLGYVTVRAFTAANGTGSTDTWDAGTDALAGGTGGTQAQNTNYYNFIRVTNTNTLQGGK